MLGFLRFLAAIADLLNYVLTGSHRCLHCRSEIPVSAVRCPYCHMPPDMYPGDKCEDYDD